MSKKILGLVLGLVMVMGVGGVAYAATTVDGTTLQFQGGSAGETEKIDFDSGGSMIYDDWNLHIATDDKLYLDAEDVIIGNGSAAGATEKIEFGSTGSSQIYDDWNLYIVTDDYLYLDPGTAVRVDSDLNPTTDATYDLGSATLAWSTGYIDDLMLFYGETIANTVDGTIAVTADTTTFSGDITVTGGEVLFTPIDTATSTSEGNVYYDSDDNNLYVHDGVNWIDLTASAGSGDDLDTVYDNGSTADVTVDAYNVQWNLYDGNTDYDFIVNIQGSSNFDVQDAGASAFKVADGGLVTIAGPAAGEGSNALAVTKGDITITDGDLTLAGGELSATTGATSGVGHAFNVATVTSGQGIRITYDESVMSGGTILEVYGGDDSTVDWSVAENGATTIRGSVEGTDALTLTTGDVTLSDGDLTLDGGELAVTGATAHSLTSSGGAITVTAGAASTWSAAIGDLTVAASDTGNAGDYDLILLAGNSAPSSAEDGNDVAIETEDDFLVETTDDANLDIGGSYFLTAADATDNAIELSATANTGGVHILAGDGEVTAVGTDESIELRATADTIVALTAGGSLVVDGDSTNSTNTAGALDINVGTTTANVVGMDIALTQDTGTSEGDDVFAQKITLTGNDADGDMFGLKIVGAATAAATTGTYEAGIFIDNVENSASSMTDAILVTSSGVDGGVVDAFDASADNITNALNVGANTITGTTAVIDFTDFDVNADGLMTFASDGAGDQITIATPAADFQALVVDASTLDSTQTAGMIDLNVDSVTDNVIGGLSLAFAVNDSAGITAYGNKTDLTVDSDAAHDSTVHGEYIGITSNDDGSTITGLTVQVESGGAQAVDQGIDIVNNDDTAMTIGQRIRAVGGNITTALEILASGAHTIATGISMSAGTGAITTALDVSDGEIGAALSYGANTISGTGTMTGGTIVPSAVDTYDLGSTSAEWQTLFIGDTDPGINFGQDQDVQIRWDNSEAALEIEGGLVAIGQDPTGGTATADGDLFVEDALEVDGVTDLDSTVDVDVTAAAAADAVDIGVTANHAGAIYGLTINQLDGSEPLDAAIMIDTTAETTAGDEMTDGILFAVTGAADIVDAVDASDSNITNAINVGANTILGTTGLINYTYFDVAATGGVTLTPSAIDTVPMTVTGKENSTATIFDLNLDAVGGTVMDVGLSGSTLSAALTGLDFNFSTNVTNTNQAQTGIKLTMKDGSSSGTAIGLDIDGTVDYGIDLDGLTAGTDIQLQNEETISNSTDGEVAINGTVVIGTGSATGTIESSGNYNVVLQTGHTSTGNITIAGTAANGDISISPNGTGDVVMGAEVVFTPGTQEITAAVGTLTPTSTVMKVTGDGAQSITDIAAGTDGQLLIIVNVDATDTVTLTEAGNIVSVGSFAMTVNESMVFVYTNSKWIELSRSDNST